MTTYVVATAGHVDHGKSTLVRALTGMEPDRWAEERRRGLTIDLGFAWVTLPSGREVAFVDVPGHERFLGNMLAGVGPVRMVCFVVAADEGWSVQSSDHRDAVAALGIEHGIVVITRADRASDGGAAAAAQARGELQGTGLAHAPVVVVSAVTGDGMDDLRAALDGVLAALPAPDPDARVRLWLDRSFSITGSGTVVTGTLAAGSAARGERFEVVGPGRDPLGVTVRGLQSRGRAHDRLSAVDRVALNLRGVTTDQVGRGDALVTPGAWPLTAELDVRRMAGADFDRVPEHVTVHVGTAAVPARVRVFDADHARLTLDTALPLAVGDRLLLREPGGHRVLGGAHVLDPEPPRLRRRGDGRRRGEALARMTLGGDVVARVARSGAVPEELLRRLGLVGDDPALPAEIRVIDGWWLHLPTYDAWTTRLRDLVEAEHTHDPLSPGISEGALREDLGPPADRFLGRLIADAGCEQTRGHVRLPGAGGGLGAAEAGVAELERRLGSAPFAAPEADELAALGLGVRELAAAEAQKRLLRLGDGVVVLPTAPALAMRELARLPQPFTTSEARQALGTSRRIAIPLLEHLDGRGWTRRVDDAHREVVR
jgi:selenocysteine-specific elongation factor